MIFNYQEWSWLVPREDYFINFNYWGFYFKKYLFSLTVYLPLCHANKMDNNSNR